MAEQDVVRLGEWIGVVGRVAQTQLDLQEVSVELSPGLFGASGLMLVHEQLRAVARSDLNVILVGPTGTGKEVFACALHGQSVRRGSFLGLNCAALPEHLAEGEMFGYRKGAFTGADRDYQGVFRAATSGTLLLDEVVELDMKLQPKLLRALQERSVVPLGQTKPHEIDVRIVAAAQAPLDQAVEAGTFRADLYSRLNGIEVFLPALAERREEIVPAFIRCLSEDLEGAVPELDPDLVERLCLYDWPMNVREVVQVARRVAVLHGKERMLTGKHVPQRILDASEPRRPEAAPSRSSSPPSKSRAEQHRRAVDERDEQELSELLAVLRKLHGNVTAAARELGISRQRAYRLIENRDDVDIDALRRSGPPS